MRLSPAKSILCVWNQEKSEINLVFVLKREYPLGGALKKTQSLFCTFLSPFLLLSPPSYTTTTTGQGCLFLTAPRSPRVSSCVNSTDIPSAPPVQGTDIVFLLPSCFFPAINVPLVLTLGKRTRTGILCPMCLQLKPELKNYLKCHFSTCVVDVLSQWKQSLTTRPLMERHSTESSVIYDDPPKADTHIWQNGCLCGSLAWRGRHRSARKER